MLTDKKELYAMWFGIMLKSEFDGREEISIGDYDELLEQFRKLIMPNEVLNYVCAEDILRAKGVIKTEKDKVLLCFGDE